MLFPDVRLELGICCETKMDGCPIRAEGAWDCALRTEELGSSVDTFFVLAKTYCSIESSIARLGRDRIDVCARIWSKLEVI
jgi:hypothetical protein